MNLHLNRFSHGVDSTLGVMFIGSGMTKIFNCFTLEDQHQNEKIPDETRIPAGKYEIKLRNEGGMTQRYAEKFDFHKGMLELQNVPDFKYVYIHIGNTDDHTSGCILVGETANHNPKNGGGTISKSTNAYKNLYLKVIRAMDRNEQVFIKIEDMN